MSFGFCPQTSKLGKEEHLTNEDFEIFKDYIIFPRSHVSGTGMTLLLLDFLFFHQRFFKSPLCAMSPVLSTMSRAVTATCK